MSNPHKKSSALPAILEILRRQNTLNDEQISHIQRRIQRTGMAPHQAILDLGYASQETVYQALAEATSLPLVKLANITPAAEAVQKVPAKVALHYSCVPLELNGGVLKAAFPAPLSLRERENLRLLLGLRLNPVMATPSELNQTLKKIYGLGADTVMQLQQNRTDSKEMQPSVSYDDISGQDLTQDKEAASIIRLVNQILLEALEMKTTDIHLEPFPDTVKLRYRIDGMLQDVPTPPGMRDLHSAIISRLKVMSNLNIAEKRLPHDGRIRVRIGNDNFDLRISILPTRFGETLCLRILNRQAIFMDMDHLGFNQPQLAILKQLIHLPHGMILVTGPTGCGKTTTLYAALANAKKHDPERKIITVEDPVEYELENTTQLQMRSEIGLTFANGLRSILRHDPDIILVGEIRDTETAEIAIRSALTGHLVLSTLHTNDAVEAVNRLIDIGVEPYLVASSLVAVLAQRLVRRICHHCKEPEPNIPDHIRKEIAEACHIQPEQVQAFQGKGCQECNKTGYTGRIAVLEIFLLNEVVQDLVNRHVPTRQLRKTARDSGMISLREAGWEKVSAGITTIDEINRITGNLQLSYKV